MSGPGECAVFCGATTAELLTVRMLSHVDRTGILVERDVLPDTVGQRRDATCHVNGIALTADVSEVLSSSSLNPNIEMDSPRVLSTLLTPLTGERSTYSQFDVANDDDR